MRLSYDFSTVVSESRRMAYGCNSVIYDDCDISPDWFDNGEAADL